MPYVEVNSSWYYGCNFAYGGARALLPVSDPRSLVSQVRGLASSRKFSFCAAWLTGDLCMIAMGLGAVRDYLQLFQIVQAKFNRRSSSFRDVACADVQR